jgi:capsular polysaccharide biosynthesis protein
MTTTSPPTFEELPNPEDRPDTSRNRSPRREWSTPRPTVVQALRRYWFLVLFPAIVLGGAGAALALKRAPTYTSEASLNVGKADPNSPSFGGFVTAASGLAAVYSRAVDAPGVIGPVSQKLHLSEGLVAQRLSATPVQDTPIIRVIGTAPSASAAESAANAGAGQLIRYVTSTNRENPDASRLYAQYRDVARQKANSDMALVQDHKQLDNDPGNPVLQARVEHDTAMGNALGLRLNALNGAYVAAEAGQSSTQVVTPLTTATAASSDRSSKLQTVAGTGVLAGLVIGVLLAMWRANSVARRRLFG